MEIVKRYILRNFEQVFVLVLLVGVGFINHLAPYKLAFLNFYYIPVLLAAYYLGTRQAVLGASLAVVLVSIYASLFPDRFAPAGDGNRVQPLDLAANIATWGCFLVLTGAAVGRLNQKLKQEILHATGLSQELQGQKGELEKTARQLQEHSEHLEEKVSERTESLQRSKEAIEDLKTKVEEALYTTMDPSVVKLMIEKRLRTEKRKITVLLCDLQGFTSFSEERPPEVVVTELNRLFKDMEGILLNYQAHIDKYMGDAILAEFGAPIDHQRHALLAVMAGIKMQEALQRGNYPWAMRVAITTGESIVGLIGHKRQSYTALGDVVNLASRVEKLCTPGRITIDEATCREVKPFFTVQRKVVAGTGDTIHLGLNQTIADLEARLELEPDNFALLKQAGLLCVQAGEAVSARDHLKRALALNPEDTEVKLAFADVTLKVDDQRNIAIRGKRNRIQLYEIIGLKNPLLDRERIPQALFDAYAGPVEQAVGYPADLILPVECLDASVGHSRVVGFLAFAIADKLGLPDMEKRILLEAGYLADIGKTIVSHHVLNRSENLAGTEFEEFTKHCREGVRKLKQMGYDAPPLFEIVEAHQELFNGGGYPNGWAGQQIPLGARIVAVADAYASLTAWRPHRDRWEFRAAFAELEKETARGKFDPRVTACLGGLLGLVHPGDAR
jgi:adenylate cyclase